MGIEIEAKFRVTDPADIRRRLQAAGAQPCGEVLEDNTYFDTPDGRLRGRDSGLRLRIIESPAGRTAALTYKGPRRQGELKVRPEAEVAVDSPEAAGEILAGLGLAPTGSFQKRRESFLLGEARIELDELPELGFFLEIEAPTEEAVRSARRRLALADQPTVTETYMALVAEHLAGRRKELSF